MKYILLFFTALIVSCENKLKKETKSQIEEPVCEKGTRPEVGYKYGFITDSK